MVFNVGKVQTTKEFSHAHAHAHVRYLFVYIFVSILYMDKLH
jgi:hypothetical protein